MKQRMQSAIEVSGKMKLYRSILLNLRIGSEQRQRNKQMIIFTMKSLILAQDER